MHKLYSTKNSALGTIFSLLCFFVTMAQPQPDWNKFSNVKERVDTMRRYAIKLIRKQQPDAGITVLNNGLIVSRQASLDSATGAFLFLLGSAHRYKSENDSAFYYLGKAKKIAVQGKYISLQADIEGETYGIYNRAGKTDSATAVINRLKEILPLLDSNSRESAKGEMYLGHNTKHQANYTEALAHYYKALRTFTYLKDSVNIGIMYVSLANILVILGQPDKALDYHRQAADLFTLLNRRTELINELLNITDMYVTANKLDSAEASIKRASPIAEQVNDKNALAYINLDLGDIYKRRKKFTEAEAYLLKATSMAEALGSETLLMEASQGLGEVYMFEKQPARAEPYLEKHLSLAKKDNNLEEMIEASWNISENEYALHDYAKAYEYKNLYSSYRDSSFRQTSTKSIAEMEAKYQAEKKENEIIVLKKDQQLDRLSLQKQKNFQIGAIIFLLLLLLIGFLLINRYRLAQRTKRVIDMERMRNSLARDLHDDIGSTLTSINILSKVALQQQSDGDALMVANMQKIKDRSSAIMESVSDIVWAINPQNDTTEQMIFRMKEFTAEILEPLNINYSFKEEGDLASLKLNIKKRKDLYLLFKEAINNAAKYSRCNNLTIQLKREGDSLHLSVKDDGAGFNVQEIKNGNGLRNMRDRAAAMGAKINIDTAIGKGTGIVVDAPIT